MTNLPPSRFFPPAENADAEGVVGFGGKLTPEWLLDAYQHGIFPWPTGDPTLPGAVVLARSAGDHRDRSVPCAPPAGPDLPQREVPATFDKRLFRRDSRLRDAPATAAGRPGSPRR